MTAVENGGITGHSSRESKKSPVVVRPQGFDIGAWQCPTLTWGGPTLPSALSIFTSEFEMGSGGSYSLLPPGEKVNNLDCFDVSDRARISIIGVH